VGNLGGSGEVVSENSKCAKTHPVFRAPLDSGCTATCTNELARLINVRPCDEEFKVADGKTANCKIIGDMPVRAKCSDGSVFSFTLRNVRYVPNFKYTLLSVGQLWTEQKIDARFADARCLEFHDNSGVSIPFDRRFVKLPVVTLISSNLLEESESCAVSEAASHTCCVGFHNIKSVAHISKLPAAQASE